MGQLFKNWPGKGLGMPRGEAENQEIGSLTLRIEDFGSKRRLAGYGFNWTICWLKKLN